MSPLDKKVRLYEVVKAWAESTDSYVQPLEVGVLTSLILAELASIEQEEEVRNAELNVSTMPEEARADNA